MEKDNLHVINVVKDLMQRFDGYVGKEETKKKIYRDVFKMGDQVNIFYFPLLL